MFKLIHRFNTFTYCSKCIKSCLFSSYTNVERLKQAIKNGPELNDFISNSIDTSKPFVVARNNPIPYISENDLNGDGRKGKLMMILIKCLYKFCFSLYESLWMSNEC